MDRFFDPSVIPPEVFANYHWAGSSPYWGEDVPGMAELLAGYEEYGRDEMEPDWYILAGYLWANFSVEVFRRALEAEDLTPDGILTSVRSINGWTADGISQPISLETVPYDAGRLIRISRPIMGERTWEPIRDFAVPQSDGAGSS